MPHNSQPSALHRPVPFADTWASVLFDLLRALAAFIVLFGHWRNLFFVDFPQLTAHRSLLAVFYLLSSAGHQAVIVFFVLSGYFIGGSVLRSIQRSRWDWPAYLLRRGVRLWIVLAPALLLCLLCDTLGIRLGHAPALYAGQVANHVIPNVPPLLAPHIFFGNLFFLQTIRGTPVFGSDGALWSLANEFWYYLLFPLAVLALWRGASAGHRLLAAALFLLAAWFVGIPILADFPIWLAGALLYKLPLLRLAPLRARRWSLLAALLYAPIFFALSKVHFALGPLGDYVLAVPTLLLLWLLLSLNGAYPPRALRVRVVRRAARFSYTLYAVHLPFLLLIASFTLGDTRWTPSPLHLALAALALLAALVYAYGVAFLTEFRTDALRRRLEHRFHLRSASSALPSNPVAR